MKVGTQAPHITTRPIPYGDIRDLLGRAARFLEHPDVVAMPFSLNSSVVATQLRNAIAEITQQMDGNK